MYLSEQEGDNVRGLPVAGVEEVRQSHRRESRQGVGAVQGVVDPFGSPPLGSNYRSKTLVQTGGSQRGFQGSGSSLQVRQEAAPWLVPLLRGNNRPRARCLLTPREERTGTSNELSLV